MLLSLLVVVALAAEPTAPPPKVEAPGPAVVPIGDTSALLAAISSIQRVADREVLVGAAGPAAEDAVLALGDRLPAGARRIVRVGVLGAPEAEVRRALEQAQLTCGVRVAPVEGGLDVRAVGDCAARDPRATTPAPDAALPPPADPEALERSWREQALVRVNLGPRAPVPWTVKDGKGRALGALELARLTGDVTTQRVLQAEARRAKWMSASLGIVGLGIGVSALGVLAGLGGEEPNWSDYEPAPAAFATRAAYDAAFDSAEARFQADIGTWEIRRADAAWAAAAVSGAAVIVSMGAPLVREGTSARAKEIAWHWTVEQADARLATYNDSLRHKLGLSGLAPVRGALPAPVQPFELPEAPDAPTAPAPEAPR